MKNNTIIIRTSREDGSTQEITLDQAIQNLAGYWIESRIKGMLLEGEELFTPYNNYKMKIPQERIYFVSVDRIYTTEISVYASSPEQAKEMVMSGDKETMSQLNNEEMLQNNCEIYHVTIN